MPLYYVAVGRWHSVSSVPTVVPWRLLLAVDLALILTRLFVAYRAWGLLRSRRPGPRLIGWAAGFVVLVVVGAAVNFVGDFAAWFQSAGPLGPGKEWVQALVDWTYEPGRWVSIVAMVVLLGMAFCPNITDDVYRAEPAESDDAEPAESDDAEPAESDDADAAESAPVAATGEEGFATPAVEDGGVIICCSGGGIRAAAFSLGGLQVLQEQGIYQKASAVVGVSGGGYTAASNHVVRWNVHRPAESEVSSPAGANPWCWLRNRFRRNPVVGDWNLQPAAMHPFAATSSELHWLRRHTRYVMDSVGTLVHAVLSLAFGITINILLIVIAIGALGWLLGWFFLASGRLTVGRVLPEAHSTLPTVAEFGGDWGADWKWVPCLCVLPVIVGLGAFLLEKLIDRFFTVWVKVRSCLRATSRFGLFGGAALSALMLGVPWIVEAASEWAASSSSTLAWLIHQAGVVPDDLCVAMLADARKACGVEMADVAAGVPLRSSAKVVNSVSVVAVVSSVLAVLASLSNQMPSKGNGKSGSRLLGKMWSKIKDPVIPYVAVAVIAVVAVISLLRTVILVVTDGKTIVDWKTGLVLTAALIAIRVFTEPNRTSMHQYFRERISQAFFVFRRSEIKAEPIDYRQPLRFSEAGPKDDGPRLVACAVANVTDSDLIPSKRGCTPFVFSDTHMGLTEPSLPERSARRASAAYEFAADEQYRDATIPAAVAMSAAAFSPLAGRENVRIAPYRVVLAIGNARLGVWLPNPLWVDEVALVTRLLTLGRYAEARAVWIALSEADRKYLRLTSRAVRKVAWGDEATETPQAKGKWSVRLHVVWGVIRGVFKKPGIFSLVKEAFGSASVYDRFLYVTDGGHYDNLGLIEALRRKPRVIYVLDASNDPEDTFRALGEAMSTAEMDLGCDVTLDPRIMLRHEGAPPNAAWCSGTCRYSDGTEGEIHVVKAILTANAPWDVEAYASAHPDFPRTNTGQQLYSEFDFESYRALGHYATTGLLKNLKLYNLGSPV